MFIYTHIHTYLYESLTKNSFQCICIIILDLPHYVLTPDNFLKITMALTRVQAGIPVIIMGEAGCGKTSMINFAGHLTNANVVSFPLHGGITRHQIEEFLRNHITCHTTTLPLSNRRSLWIFLDEINTCNALGFIKTVICDRFLSGVDIPPDVFFFAACNPYKRMKRQDHANIIGLQSARSLRMTDNLVYRVKPLPESMLDYVWDFGALILSDEKRYIMALMKDIPEMDASIKKLFCSLVSKSQQFIRETYGNSAVSMRDVRRSKTLILWFSSHVIQQRQYGNKWKYIPLILCLTHCYRVRLQNNELRRRYDNLMQVTFREENVIISADDIRKYIQQEQQAYIKEMKFIGKGIAMNFSLRENVFVLLVCILTKIPVVLIGKPGSSKTLAISLIISHLRGRDSQSYFFKKLPEVVVISFQGSESSTSDGIKKVFKKAEDMLLRKEGTINSNNNNINNNNNNNNINNNNNNNTSSASDQIIPLILLDEIGLAEISPHNPLKVLHSKLETSDDSELRYAVIGISNWSLDASKMSRVIQLSRPEPDASELLETAKEIVAATGELDMRYLPRNVSETLTNLAKNFDKYYQDQKHSRNKDFHGLRDFYSTCKSLGKMLKENREITNSGYAMAICRNFGGLQSTSVDNIIFGLRFKKKVNIIDMIICNLQDELSRHLMIITEGDAILNAMDSIMDRAGIHEYRVMIGSKFKDDNSENYRYRMLSEIILSMERGESLILRDLDTIHGSLYDMLNQNYTIINGKKNCRVALGAYSNPVASVHDKFKCIVVADSKRAYQYDPPFLNRHEKQYCPIFDLLNQVSNIIIIIVNLLLIVNNIELDI